VITIYGKEVPTRLSELVDPEKTALLFIDMQNDCCSPGGAADAAGGDISIYRDTIPCAAALAEVCREIGVPVIHVGMHAKPRGESDSPAWLRLRVRTNRNFDPNNEGIWNCMIEGTWGAEFVPELTPREGEPVIWKRRSSAFFETELDDVLRSLGVDRVLVAGCTTEGCVESTVRDLSFRDYFGIVLSDCVGSDVPELHEASMLVMSAYRADVATSVEVMEIWGARAR
jgi:nicotinamidase-related amidase